MNTTRERRGFLDHLVLALGTGLYSGLIPPRIATLGATLGVPLAYGMHALLGWHGYLPATAVLCVAGVLICGRSARILDREDPREVVYDEIATMPIVFFWAPSFSWPVLIVGFALHRFFDISKVLGVDRLQKWPGGWGIMADDVLSSIYAWLALQGLFHLGLR